MQPTSTGEAQELERVRRLCDPAHVAPRTLTFAPRPEAVLGGAWANWLTSVFAPLILATVPAIMAATHQEHAHDVVKLDRALAAALPTDASLRSRAAGQAAAEYFDGLRGSRCAARLVEEAAAGGGCHASAFALRAALYHVSPRAALLALAWQEWRGGLNNSGARPSEASTELALEQAAALIDAHLRQLTPARSNFAVLAS